jgi:hypothetical protein
MNDEDAMQAFDEWRAHVKQCTLCWQAEQRKQ